MKVGDLVRHKHSDRGMMGIVVEIISWRHAKNKTPFVLWDVLLTSGKNFYFYPNELEVICEV